MTAESAATAAGAGAAAGDQPARQRSATLAEVSVRLPAQPLAMPISEWVPVPP